MTWSDNMSMDEDFIPEEVEPALLELRKCLMNAGGKDPYGLGNVMCDIINEIVNSGIPSSWEAAFPIVARLIYRWLRRRSFRSVMQDIVIPLLDPTQDYDMSLGLIVQATCNARLNLSPFDHGNIYRIILARLRRGSIRDFCAEHGLIRYLNKKLNVVESNYLIEKTRGTVL